MTAAQMPAPVVSLNTFNEPTSAIVPCRVTAYRVNSVVGKAVLKLVRNLLRHCFRLQEV